MFFFFFFYVDRFKLLAIKLMEKQQHLSSVCPSVMVCRWAQPSSVWTRSFMGHRCILESELLAFLLGSRQAG